MLEVIQLCVRNPAFCLFLQDGENIFAYSIMKEHIALLIPTRRKTHEVCMDFLGRKTMNPLYMQYEQVYTAER